MSKKLEDTTEELEFEEEELEEYYQDNSESEKKAKQRRKRRKKHPLLRFLLFCAVLYAAYVTATSDLFMVTEIQVNGNHYYTKAQIIEMAQLQTGYNLFKMETGSAKNSLLSDPYIKTAEIKKVLRGTIQVNLEEREEYAAVPYGDEYVLIDKDGMVLRITSDVPVLPLLQNMTIMEMTPGKALAVEQSYLLSETLNLIAAMEENDLFFKKIDFSTVIVRAYIYDNYYCEGTPSNILENLSAVRQLVEEHFKQDITRGVIKVGKGNYLAFSPQIE